MPAKRSRFKTEFVADVADLLVVGYSGEHLVVDVLDYLDLIELRDKRNHVIA